MAYNYFTEGRRMINCKEILKLHELGHNNTRIAEGFGWTRSAVITTLRYANRKGLTWNTIQDWINKDLAEKLLPNAESGLSYKCRTMNTTTNKELPGIQRNREL